LPTSGIRMLPTFRPMEPAQEEEDEDIEIEVRM